MKEVAVMDDTSDKRKGALVAEETLPSTGPKIPTPETHLALSNCKISLSPFGPEL
jgi:hypothetical protein